MSSERDRESERDRQMEKIRRLLTKAESTPYPEEAEAFLVKVAELAARYSIDDARLWAESPSSSRDKPIERSIRIQAPHAARKATLVGAVAESFGCMAIRLGGASNMSCSIVGFEGDVRRTESLVTSLFIQLTNAMLAESPTGIHASRVAAWRRSFITAYAFRISQRLSEVRSAQTESDVADSAITAVALRDRSDEVDAEMRSRYPHVRTSRVDGGSSRDGQRAGQRAANRTDLGGSAVSGARRKSLR